VLIIEPEALTGGRRLNIQSFVGQINFIALGTPQKGQQRGEAHAKFSSKKTTTATQNKRKV